MPNLSKNAALRSLAELRSWSNEITSKYIFNSDLYPKYPKLFGCGALSNPPAHIAKLFHQVMEEPEFKNAFKRIAFAILDGYRIGLRHNPEGNLLPFQKEFDCVPQNGTTSL